MFMKFECHTKNNMSIRCSQMMNFGIIVQHDCNDKDVHCNFRLTSWLVFVLLAGAYIEANGKPSLDRDGSVNTLD